jgi:hypothetical protein
VPSRREVPISRPSGARGEPRDGAKTSEARRRIISRLPDPSWSNKGSHRSTSASNSIERQIVIISMHNSSGHNETCAESKKTWRKSGSTNSVNNQFYLSIVIKIFDSRLWIYEIYTRYYFSRWSELDEIMIGLFAADDSAPRDRAEWCRSRVCQLSLNSILFNNRHDCSTSVQITEFTLK